MDKTLKRVTIILSEEQHEYLRVKAFEQRTSISNLARRAIDDYIARLEGKKAEEEARA